MIKWKSSSAIIYMLQIFLPQALCLGVDASIWASNSSWVKPQRWICKQAIANLIYFEQRALGAIEEEVVKSTWSAFCELPYIRFRKTCWSPKIIREEGWFHRPLCFWFCESNPLSVLRGLVNLYGFFSMLKDILNRLRKGGNSMKETHSDSQSLLLLLEL